ncbi:N-acetyltransferase [Bacillus velezensis]|uniref:N-acetyltransferase n=1 Tax=Bacillus velezensis TaxID=492670 RepID=UPI001F183205|nr:N-acetyltransferase [Bacillus velezensis]
MYIRRLTANDTKPDTDIRLKASKDHPDARLESGNAIVLGAFEKDRLMGILKISKHSLFNLRYIAVIGSMYISPKHRRSGAEAKKMKDTEQLPLSVTQQMNPQRNSTLSQDLSSFLQKKER